MRRRVPLFMAVDRGAIASGVQPDLHPLHRTLWNDSANVVFAAGKVKRLVPAALLFSTVGLPVRGLSQQQTTSGKRWLWAAVCDINNNVTVVRWYGPAYEGIEGRPGRVDETSLAPATFIDFTHFGDWTIANGWSDGSRRLYKQSAGEVIVQTSFGDAPAGAARFLKFRNFILACGHGARGTQVSWSDADNIEVWTATKDNLAGSLTIDGFETAIKAALPLGSSIAVYAEDQMALVNYIGSTAQFGFKPALDGIGACGKFSVAGDGKQHYGVGRNGVWWTDGLSFRYIDEGVLHDYLQDRVNWAQQSKIVAARNDVTGCFEFSFPMYPSTEPSEAWSYDPRNGGWSMVPYFTCKDERRLFDKPIMGSSDGKVWLDSSSPDALAPLSLITKPLTVQAESDSMGYSNVHIASKVDEVVLLFHEVEAVQFRLHCSHSLDGPYVQSAWQNCPSLSASTFDIESMQDGVYWRLEFRSTAARWVFNLQGFMLFGVVEGTKRDVA